MSLRDSSKVLAASASLLRTRVHPGLRGRGNISSGSLLICPDLSTRSEFCEDSFCFRITQSALCFRGPETAEGSAEHPAGLETSKVTIDGSIPDFRSLTDTKLVTGQLLYLLWTPRRLIKQSPQRNQPLGQPSHRFGSGRATS